MNIAGLRGRIIEVKTLTIIQAGISAVGLINGFPYKKMYGRLARTKNHCGRNYKFTVLTR